MDKISIIQFTKIRDVKSPNRANKNDAGADFYIPEFSLDFKKAIESDEKNNKVIVNVESQTITVMPHSEFVIPSGIKCNVLDKNTYLDVANKSGISTNKCMIKLAHVIDADYRGEIFFSLFNLSPSAVTFKFGQKIIQLIQKEYIKSQYEFISEEDFNNLEETDRGEGGRGSSGV